MSSKSGMYFIASISLAIASCNPANMQGTANSRKNPGHEDQKLDKEENIPVESDDAVKIDSDNGNGTIKNEKKLCEMYLYTNRHHGCGPSQVASWAVWIGDSVPKLTNNAWPAKEVTDLAVDQGFYGVNHASFCKHEETQSCCDEHKLLPGYKTMPESIKIDDFTYTLFTSGQPGHIDCPAYRINQSPLLISFDHDKMTLLNPTKGPIFDLDASGFKGRNSWPANGKTQMFVVLDKNRDGLITSGEELFGNFTTGPDGQKSANGFEALKKHDSNGDGQINSLDSIFSDIQLWGDANSNGLSEPAELHSLKSMHVKSVSLSYSIKPARLDPFGSEVKEVSNVILDSGEQVLIGDYWFVAGPKE